MIQELRKKIIEANNLYRIGKPVISDNEFDTLLEELSLLSPDDELLNKVGHSISDDRKSRLPIEMASMNKIKSIEDINDWVRLKSIPTDTTVIITPKFDGLSLCVDETKDDAWTRGDGQIGQKSKEHYKLIQDKLYSNVSGIDTMSGLPFKFSYGEVMMSKKVFLDKYSMDFANPRNLVAGLMNSKDATEPLKDCQYIVYGGIPCKGINFTTKQEIIDELNSGKNIKVDYHICNISNITEDLLIDLFKKWSIDYEIDGVIIEVNDLSLQKKLGRETSSKNPTFARAFKHPSFEQCSESEVIGVTWNISKQGYLKPIINIKPIRLDGVTVSNVTGNNARFVKDMGIGIGSIVKIVRSGMVIPKIVDVVKSVEFSMPNIPNIDWNENGIELITLSETDDQKLKKIVAFFEILEAKNISEGVIKQLWDAGYKTIKDILNLTINDLSKIDRFGKRKSEIVFNSINACISNVTLSKLQHATGLFKGLGSLKLIKLEHFKVKPTIEEVMSIEGFAETSSKSYIDGYDKFFDFIKDLPITIKEKDESVKISNDLDGMSFVFTGVRRSDLVKLIESKGGKEVSSVSKNTTHLVCSDKSSVSSKMKKAMDLGIKILGVKELEEILK